MVKVSEGKYQVGDSNTLIFIRVSLVWSRGNSKLSIMEFFPWNPAQG
jgi:hypothetical protein